MISVRWHIHVIPVQDRRWRENGGRWSSRSSTTSVLWWPLTADGPSDLPGLAPLCCGMYEGSTPVKVNHACCNPWVQWPCPVQNTAFHSTQPPALKVFPDPLSQCSARLGGGDRDDLLRAEPWTVIYAHTWSSYESVLAAACCRKKLCWPRLRAALGGSYKHGLMYSFMYLLI